MKTVSESYVAQFLEKVKVLTRDNKITFYDERPKNLATLEKLRKKYLITHDDVIDEVTNAILNLSTADYYEGPDCDNNENRGCIFWKFGIRIFGDHEIYLKLQLDNNNSNIVCWSFHFPDYKISYPLKKKGEKNENN